MKVLHNLPLSHRTRTPRGPPLGTYAQPTLCPLKKTERLKLFTPDGLLAIRPPGGAICNRPWHPSRRIDGDQYEEFPSAAGQYRLLLRLGPAGAHQQALLLPMDTMDFSAIFQKLG